jgi:hypothetical protein
LEGILHKYDAEVSGTVVHSESTRHCLPLAGRHTAKLQRYQVLDLKNTEHNIVISLTEAVIN